MDKKAEAIELVNFLDEAADKMYKMLQDTFNDALSYFENTAKVEYTSEQLAMIRAYEEAAELGQELEPLEEMEQEPSLIYKYPEISEAQESFHMGVVLLSAAADNIRKDYSLYDNPRCTQDNQD